MEIAFLSSPLLLLIILRWRDDLDLVEDVLASTPTEGIVKFEDV